jgi:hypothetical protein
MTLYTDERPHPLGITYNAEWDAVLTRRAELYLAERARREDPEREPARMNIALGILAVIFIAAALIGAVTR